MNFLEAHKIVKNFKSDKTLSFLLASSGETENLDIFLRAYAALSNFECDYERLAFNTLQQTIALPPNKDRPEAFILLPWDFLPELDWRTGIPEKIIELEQCHTQINDVTQKLNARPNAQFIYIDAPLPPIFHNHTDNLQIKYALIDNALHLNATILDVDYFSLSGHLTHGHPFSGSHANQLCKEIISKFDNQSNAPYKVLVTDLDNVMWHGIIGEDGIEGIHYHPEDIGYSHFIYQNYLKKLKQRGILLAAVSRNDRELALKPFNQGDMTLKEDDFIAIIASYEAKSSQIQALSETLNLGLESFVFIDDNPIEIEEVSKALPNICCKTFPSKQDMLPSLLSDLASLFSSTSLTQEDTDKTSLYKQRLKGIAPSNIKGADLDEFLNQLDMSLCIQKKSPNNNTRAIQLINKTNQFNLNGINTDKNSVNKTLNDGGYLFTAELSDRHGSHGEVLACLINRNKEVISFVMSCRIFQRHAEYAFLSWILKTLKQERLTLKFLKTERNIPFQNFINADSFDQTNPDNTLLFCDQFIKRHNSKLKRFKITFN